jgi:hypothetical protein
MASVLACLSFLIAVPTVFVAAVFVRLMEPVLAARALEACSSKGHCSCTAPLTRIKIMTAFY